jgi:nucleotide-binding universal stress UspA family protein
MTNNSVLVPLDGSTYAEKALQAADTFLKSKNDGCLTILRALETPRLSAWLPAEMLSLHQREQEIVREYLEEKRKEWEGRGYEVRTVLAPGPGPVEATITECSEGRAQLVILTSHGASGWMEFFLGSNTEKIMRLCPAQILVIKSLEDDEQAAALPKRILIPLDGSERAEKAIPQALDIAPGGSAKIILVGVSVVFKGHAFEGDMRTVVRPDLDRVQEYLETQAEWLSNQGYDVDVVVRRGDAAEQLLALAKEEDIDLILMTSQGRTGFAHWFYGSVAERIVRTSECSVLVLKETEEE